MGELSDDLVKLRDDWLSTATAQRMTAGLSSEAAQIIAERVFADRFPAVVERLSSQKAGWEFEVAELVEIIVWLDGYDDQEDHAQAAKRLRAVHAALSTTPATEEGSR